MVLGEKPVILPAYPPGACRSLRGAAAATLERGKDRERIGIGVAGHAADRSRLQAAGERGACNRHPTIGVPGYQRQGEQQFVLDQREEIERTAGGQDVVVGFRIEARGGFLVGDEAKTASNFDRLRERLQAPLAGQRDLRMGFEAKPGLSGSSALGTALATNPPVHRVACAWRGLGMGHFDEPGEAAQRPASLQELPLLGHLLDIEQQGIGRTPAHRGSVCRRQHGDGRDR